MRSEQYRELEDWEISALERIVDGISISEMDVSEIAYEAFSEQQLIARAILVLWKKVIGKYIL